MSLINEALKRAKQAHSHTLPTKASVPPMRPVEPEQPAPSNGFGAIVPISLAVIAVAGILIFFLIWKRDNSSGSSVAPAPLPVAARTPDLEPVPGTTQPAKALAPVNAVNTASTPASMPEEHSPSVPVGTQQSMVASSPGAANPPLPATETADSNHFASAQIPPTPVPAPLKLQSIVFNPRRPSAMINGRIVFVGDRIRDLRVMSIHREDVLLVGGGNTNLLSLEP